MARIEVKDFTLFTGANLYLDRPAVRFTLRVDPKVRRADRIREAGRSALPALAKDAPADLPGLFAREISLFPQISLQVKKLPRNGLPTLNASVRKHPWSPPALDELPWPLAQCQHARMFHKHIPALRCFTHQRPTGVRQRLRQRRQ